MNKEDLLFAKEEFARTTNYFTDLSIQRMFKKEELDWKISDRRISYIATISSLSIAVIGIVYPLIDNKEDKFWGIFSLIIFAEAAIAGLIYVVLVLKRDSRDIERYSNAEQDYLRKLVAGAVDIRIKAHTGELEESHIQNYAACKEQAKNDYFSKTGHSLTNFFDGAFSYAYIFLFLIGLIPFIWFLSR